MEGSELVLTPERPGSKTLTLDPREAEAFREMLRQQLLGDEELLRDALAGREDPEIRLQVHDRINMVRRLADVVCLTEEIVERRQGSRRGRSARRHAPRSFRVPIGGVWIALGVLISTAAVYTVYRFVGAEVASLYVPWVAFATLRFGRRKGILTVAGCATAFLASPPYALIPDAEGLLAFSAMLLAIWAIRRDVF